MSGPAPVVLWHIDWRDGGGNDWDDWTAHEFIKSRDLADETEVHSVTKGTWYPAALDPASKVAALAGLLKEARRFMERLRLDRAEQRIATSVLDAHLAKVDAALKEIDHE